ncbi:MAG: PAS domain-containing protein [Coriobacteriia bacterium]|nr:PAS domain-containing protein [Coriobacteriia bacterium]
MPREALRSDLLRSILDREPVGVCLYQPTDGADFVHAYVNPAFQALKPFRPMLERTFSEVWPELAALAIPRFHEVLETGVPWRAQDLPLEVEVEPGITRTRYYTFETSRLEAAAGKLILDTKTDVTAEVETREALRESEAKYRNLFTNLIDGFALHEIVVNERGEPVDYVFLEVNEAFERLSGLKASEIVGKRVTEVLPGVEHDPADWIGRYGRVALTGEPIRFEQYAQPLEKWYAVSAYRPGEGRFVAVFDDITERKRAEEALAQELETTRLLLSAAEALSRQTDLEPLLDSLADVIMHALDRERALVALWDEQRHEMRFAATLGEDAPPPGLAIPFDRLSEPGKRIISSRRMDVVDFGSVPEAERRATASLRLGLTLYVPIVHGERLIGYIYVDSPGERREYTDHDMRLAAAIAGQAGVAVENARLHEEQRRSLRVLKDKDRAIRQAYSDVIDAVTGGRLILLGRDEIDSSIIARAGAPHELREPSQLAEARTRVRAALGEIPEVGDLLVAFSEGATNMLKHAGGGTYRICREGHRVQFILADEGPGIDFRNLPKATLVPGFSTGQTLGMGFTLMMELTDRLLLSSDPGGTTLLLEKDLAHGKRPVAAGTGEERHPAGRGDAVTARVAAPPGMRSGSGYLASLLRRG